MEYSDDIPNGGYGWVVAICGFLSNFVMFGFASIWGVFSAAFASSTLEGKATTLELMGIGSVAIAGLNLMTPLSPLLAMLGARAVMLIGTVLLSLGIILTSFGYEVWHIYLSQGVLFGVGASLVYMTVVAVIPQYFSTRRGIAMGISSAGTGIGGLALSPMANSLIEKYGIPWAYRIIGLMSFGILLISTCLIRTRQPRPTSFKFPIQFSMLKDLDFVLWLLGAAVALMGYFTPLFYIPKYGLSIGLTRSQCSNLIAICCAMNAAGRLILGYVADRIGRLNMYIASNLLAGLLCCLLWRYATTYDTMIAFSVTWGLVCGTYFALAPPITAYIVGMEKLSSGLSILFLVSAASCTGPVIGAAIEQSTPGNGYIGVQMFSGVVYIFGGLLFIIIKMRKTGSILSIL
ncbi:MFS general substrate transporter [Hesseltinella vesiculosa]|uniref:MFS general substrate transporter n=1 Tax=Hesseltinella vesiculosa TaxID=101127 RepID=A0A1X2GV51_9FUNG|nr:MFS general substrate transporter [Hesseltinella vesiculosa]